MSRYFIKNIGMCANRHDVETLGSKSTHKTALKVKDQEAVDHHPHLTPYLELWKAKIMRSLLDYYDLSGQGAGGITHGQRIKAKHCAYDFLSSDFYEEIRDFFDLPPFNPDFSLPIETKFLFKKY